MAINFKLIDNIIWITMSAATLCLAGGGLLHHIPEGFAIFFGALWGSVNFFFLKHFMKTLLLQKKRIGKLILLAGLKWPLLYLAGYGLLKAQFFPVLFILAGFSLVFVCAAILGIREAVRYYGRTSA
jgi:hypothetical protein